MKIVGKLGRAVVGVIGLGAAASAAFAQDSVESLFQALNAPSSPVVRGTTNCPAGATVIYDTTHASTQGAEITAAANGAATCMGDKVVVIDHTRPVCEISVDVFTLAATTPFDLTLEIYTDCSTSGAANSPCGNGTGTLIPSSTTTVTGITPAALGTIFSVVFPVNNASLATETDDTITVKIRASRSDVFWRIGETPSVGAQPEGAGTSFVERCGSTAANNGCSRNFGVTNNFAMTIRGAPAVNADLSITKTDGVASVNAGGTATYTITASNAGPDAATGATVADTFPAACVSPTWTCVGAGGGTCTANGSGNISDTVNLPSGGSVTYTATCPVSSGASGSLANTATVTAPGGTTDPNTANNSATDTDTINSIAAPQFTYTPAAGSAVNFTGGTLEGSTGSASIAVAIGTPGLGTGASATTTTTCVVPGGFSGFGQTVTAEGAAATTTGGPLSGTCVLGAAQVVQTMTCTENQGGTNVTRTFDLTCPAGTAATLTSTPVSGSTVTLPSQIIGTGATTSAISFQNPGLVPATVTCVAPAAPFTANPLTINVPAGGSASTTVSLNSATAGVFADTLTCSAGQQQFTFALAGTANAPSVPVPAFGDRTRLLLVISALLMGMVTLGLRARRG
jgi:uncharacterized repeat protein (TIGR01451 family)